MPKKKKEEKIEDIKVEKKYFVSDPEKADRKIDLGTLGIVNLGAGVFETEITKEQAEALGAYTYLVINEK